MEFDFKEKHFLRLVEAYFRTLELLVSLKGYFLLAPGASYHEAFEDMTSSLFAISVQRKLSS